MKARELAVAIQAAIVADPRIADLRVDAENPTDDSWVTGVIADDHDPWESSEDPFPDDYTGPVRVVLTVSDGHRRHGAEPAPVLDPSDYQGNDVFDDVIAAMQNAEEMGGPDGAAYLELMRRIEAEARRRRETYSEILRRKGASQ